MSSHISSRYFRRSAQLGIIAVLFVALVYLLFLPVKSAQAAEVDLLSFTELLISEGVISEENSSYAEMLAVETMGSEIREPQAASVSETVVRDNIFSNLVGKVRDMTNKTFSSIKLSSGGTAKQIAALTEDQVQTILGLLSNFGVEADVVQDIESSLRGTTTTTSQTPRPVTTTDEDERLTCTNLSEALVLGDQDTIGSNEVSLLQKFLSEFSEVNYQGGATGFFGAETERAVQLLQIHTGIINPDNPGDRIDTGYGLVGPQTRAEIRLISCGTTGGVPLDSSTEGSTLITSNIYGDMNGDGRVTATDAFFVQNYLARTIFFTDEQISRADVNQDGIITERDAKIILQHAIGAIESLPITDGSGGTQPVEILDPAVSILIQSGTEYSIGDSILFSWASEDVGTCVIATTPSGIFYELGSSGEGEIAAQQNFTLLAECTNVGGGSVVVKDQVSIIVTEQEPVSPNPLLGDINGDGEVTVSDALRYFQALATGPELTSSEREVADVNEDGLYDAFDAEGIFVKSVGHDFDEIEHLNRAVGDMNLDSRITATDSSYLLRHVTGVLRLTPSQTRAADVDGDGEITNVDADAVLAHAVGIVDALPVIFGDLTGDGNITTSDAQRVLQIAAGQGNIATSHERFIADVDRDGFVTNADAELILRAAVDAVRLPVIPNGTSAEASSNQVASVENAAQNIFTFLQARLTIR